MALFPSFMSAKRIIDRIAQAKAEAIAAAGGGSYKKYVTHLIQPDTNDPPTASAFENSIGAAAWEKNSPGQYFVQTTTDFVAGKVYIAGFPVDLLSGNTRFVPIYDNDNNIIGKYFIGVEDFGDGKASIFVKFIDNTGTPIELGDLIGVNQRFFLPEVRIYP